MKTAFLIAGICLCACSLYAQDTIQCYFNDQLTLTNQRNAAFTGKMVQNSGEWEAFALYPDNKILMHGFFKDKKLDVKHGPYTLFYPDGKRKAFIGFKYNIPDSIFLTWYENGNLNDSGYIHENIKTGLWKTWYSNGLPESEGIYSGGAIDGTWNWYHTNGKPSAKEVYVNAKLSDLTCFDTLGVQTGSNCRINKKPCPEGSRSFEDFVIDNLLYPRAALKKKIEGTVEFEFFITKEGKLTRINFANETNPLLQEEVVRLLKSVQKWEPAISHNRNIDYLYSAEAPFYLHENNEE